MEQALWRLADEGLRAHVARFEAGVQGGAAWHAKRRQVVGGSEIAAVINANAYCSRTALVGRKLGLVPNDGGAACWWGTLFEGVTEQLVARACGAPVHGTGIHIHDPALIEGHANSPDGYCVVTLARGAAGWVLARPGAGVFVLPALLEFKAPYSRIPAGSVPAQYKPQIQSGIALSAPAVACGLYCEAVYRVCAHAELDDTPDYCTDYHARDPPGLWAAPEALGLIALYRAAGGDPVDELLAAGGLFEYLHMLAHGAPPRGAYEPVDLGRVAARDAPSFNRVLQLAASGALTVRYDLDDLSVEALRGAVPGGELVAYIPWKAMQVDYHLVAPDPGFLDRIRAPVAEFMGLVRATAAAPDPAAAYAALRAAGHKKPKKQEEACALDRFFD